jgi:hypothetical protein
MVGRGPKTPAAERLIAGSSLREMQSGPACPKGTKMKWMQGRPPHRFWRIGDTRILFAASALENG